MRNSLCIALVCFHLSCQAQFYDNNWILGYNSMSDAKSETILLDFTTSPPAVTNHPLWLDFASTNVTMSDSAGGFIFYSNGCQIRNKLDQPMPNGDSLNWGEIAQAYCDFGYPLPSGVIALPAPGNDHEYYLIHQREELDNDVGVRIPDLLWTKVDMDLNSGKGAVTAKNQALYNAYFFDSAMATRHANGRDWWVLVPDWAEARYYSFLLTPWGFRDTVVQEIGQKPPFPEEMDYGGQNTFSPDGSHYVDQDGRNGVRLFDFDRCTGLLSNFRHYGFSPETVYGLGAAFSPDSRFLYVCSRNHVFQFDLWEGGDLAAAVDTVATYDGFLSPPPFPTSFYMMQLGPDGKIYITHQTGAKHIHYIEYPNRKGTACGVRQHSIGLPQYKGPEWFDYPFYRLGPLDGSACDSLGLDNLPLAGFWSKVDSTDAYLVEFTDNSFYAPTDWYWDFGDNATSQDTSPVHLYTTAGTYEVCLTVSNQYGGDTKCKQVELILSGTEEAGAGDIIVSVYPNPAAHSVIFELPESLPSAMLTLYTTTGQPVLHRRIAAGRNMVALEGIASGIFFYKVWDDGKVLMMGKLVKVE